MKPIVLAMVFFAQGVWAAPEFAIGFKGELCEGNVCITGTVAPNKPVVILSKTKSKTCSSVTGEKYTVVGGIITMNGTKVLPEKGCSLPEDPFLAVFASKVKYEPHASSTLSKKDLAALDKKVKASPEFAKAYDGELKIQLIDPKAPFGTSPGDMTAEHFQKLEPVGARYATDKKNYVDLLWHKIPESHDGALFAVVGEKVSLVTKAFQSTGPRVFSIDGKTYLFTEISCQRGCGWFVTEVHEGNDGQFKGVYSNKDFSD